MHVDKDLDKGIDRLITPVITLNECPYNIDVADLYFSIYPNWDLEA